MLDALFVAGIFFIVLWPCVHFLEWFLLDAIRIERLLEPGTIVGGLLIAGVGLTVIMSLRTLTRSARERAKRRMAETIGRCAWCDYELDGLTPEADGCTVCPECGAAWRMEETKGQRGTGTEGTSTGT